MAEPELSFAGLLRRLRAEARLTQEELAEAAGLSSRSVSDLERGVNRTARKDTALLLAGALGLTGQVRVLFVAAARGRAPAADVLAAGNGAAAPGPGSAAAGPGPASPGPGSAAATRALPRDISSFTGRDAELSRLLATLADVANDGGDAGIYAIDGMAGPARRPSPSTRHTGWPAAFLTGSILSRCTLTLPVSGRSTPPTPWPACC